MNELLPVEPGQRRVGAAHDDGTVGLDREGEGVRTVHGRRRDAADAETRVERAVLEEPEDSEAIGRGDYAVVRRDRIGARCIQRSRWRTSSLQSTFSR